MRTEPGRLHLLVSCALALMIFVALVQVHGQAPAAGGQEGQGQQAQAPPAPAGGRGLPGTESGWGSFQTRCYGCHGNPANTEAQSPVAIREMTPERIYAALTTGSMQAQSEGLSDIQKQRLAEFMAGRPLGSAAAGSASLMPNRCATNPPLADPAAGPGWNGWGNGLANTRFQGGAAAGLSPTDVPRLTLKWAFGYPTGLSANGQPTVVAGRVFVGSDNGFFYALDAKTGCVYWSFEQGSIVRNAPVVGAVTGQGATRYGVFFGDGHANVYALDAQDGRLLWTTKVDPHVVARITAGSAYHEGRLFVPVSSSEEWMSGTPDYPCCTSRGSVVALDASTGRQVWKAWVVPEEPMPHATNPNGVVLYKPAGAAVWTAPTVDPVRNAVYFGTGDSTTDPPAVASDGILAVDIDSGERLWSFQATEGDVFMGGCNGPDRSAACPDPMGPDADIGNSPILVSLPGGRRALLGGTKSADVFALDPDNDGALLYRINAAGGPVGRGRGGRGAIVWGGAADGRHVYYGAGAAGLVAVRQQTGEIAWTFRGPEGGRGISLGAAPTAIPGVVFEGAGNGTLFAVSAEDGRQLWSFDTSQEVETVNRQVAHGGAISVSGAVVVDGMVYIGSGYGIASGASGGNVLLAFGVD